MHTFNFRRFILLLKRDLNQNMRGYLMTLGVIYIILMGVVYFTRFIFMHAHMGDDWREGLGIMANILILPILTFAGGYVASGICADQITKAGSISTNMLPATPLERFAQRWLVVVVFYTISAALIYFLVDASWQLVNVVERRSWPWLFETWRKTNRLSQDGIQWNITSTAVLGVLSSQATYVFAGCVFRKHPFFKMLLVQFGVQLILTLPLTAFLYAHPETGSQLNISTSAFFSWSNVIATIEIIVFYVLSYWLYSRKQVVPYRYL